MRNIPNAPLLLLLVLVQWNRAEAAANFDDDYELRFVQAIWRHGDRAPLYKPYPADQNGDSSWPRGWGQLTTEGMRQTRKLGQFLRAQYVGKFLSSKYKKSELFIRSSGEDRAIESAQSVISGMFPPEKHERFEPDLNWQPIAIHTNPKPDPLLIPFMYPCARYLQIRDQVHAEMDAKLMDKYPELMDFVRPHLAPPVANESVTMLNVKRLFHIMPEIHHGLPQPEWVLQQWPEYGNQSTMELIRDVHDQKLEADMQGNEEIRKLVGGFLLADWFTRAEQVALGQYSNIRNAPSKMMLYSAHDMTQMSLLSALKIAEPKNVIAEPPPYASCIFMELYAPKGSAENKSSVPYTLEDFQIKLLFHRNGILEQLVPEGCERNNCSLQTIKKQIAGRAIYGGVKELDTLCEAKGVPKRYREYAKGSVQNDADDDHLYDLQKTVRKAANVHRFVNNLFRGGMQSERTRRNA